MYKSRFKKKYSGEKKTKFNFKLFAVLFFVLVFFVGLFSLLRADFLRVKSFEISGADTVSKENLASAASAFVSGSKFLILPKSNKIFLDEESLSEHLMRSFGRLESVSVERAIFGSALKIKVTERTPDFLWCLAEGECFFMSSEGLVFEKVEAGWLPAYDDRPVFSGVLSADPIGKNFASPEDMRKYQNFMKDFVDAGFEVGGMSVELENKAVMNTNVGDIVFNPEENTLASSSRNAILLIKDERSKNPSARFEYIDTRFGSKLFYKIF